MRAQNDFGRSKPIPIMLFNDHPMYCPTMNNFSKFYSPSRLGLSQKRSVYLPLRVVLLLVLTKNGRTSDIISLHILLSASLLGPPQSPAPSPLNVTLKGQPPLASPLKHNVYSFFLSYLNAYENMVLNSPLFSYRFSYLNSSAMNLLMDTPPDSPSFSLLKLRATMTRQIGTGATASMN